ncbi:LacI family DNA-binding transcriptional regulator [Demequina litorisediminis]|uniref:LacI family DNA-binding transcriptional regulator n=1 Tax=Demequina litorisediminis TaxID=1849022 RepID=UPI0024E0B856|nr:LacI family DNA-binding transcriptional regulator [Demequina litorisediminis]
MTARRRGVTLAEVAARAGVSLKTASNAVNGTGRMSAATRARVEAVVEELGYKVHAAARSLTRGRTGTIALAVPSLRPAYLAEPCRGGGGGGASARPRRARHHLSRTRGWRLASLPRPVQREPQRRTAPVARGA